MEEATNDVSSTTVAFTDAERAEVKDNTEERASKADEAKKVEQLDLMVKDFCTEIKPKVEQGNTQGASLKYTIGAAVSRFKQHGGYGDRVVKTLEEELCIDQTTLWRYAAVAKVVVADEFDALMKMKNGKGLPPQWQILVELHYVKEREKRDELVELWAEKSLTAEALKALVEEKGLASKAGTKRNVASTKPVRGSDLVGSIHTWTEEAQQQVEEMTKHIDSLSTKTLDGLLAKKVEKYGHALIAEGNAKAAAGQKLVALAGEAAIKTPEPEDTKAAKAERRATIAKAAQATASKATTQQTHAA